MLHRRAAGYKFFTKQDISMQQYYTFKLDEESSNLCVIDCYALWQVLI
jgi:hypothetical protein